MVEHATNSNLESATGDWSHMLRHRGGSSQVCPPQILIRRCGPLADSLGGALGKCAQMTLDWQKSSDCVGEQWLSVLSKAEWELTLKEEFSSFGSEQDGNPDQPTALNQRGHWCKKTFYPWEHEGWCPWEEENPGAITEAVLCTFLPVVWEGHDPCHGWPSRSPLQVMPSGSPTFPASMWSLNLSAPGVSS